MPQYPDHYYQKFTAMAQGKGSGLGKTFRKDGALKALGTRLRADSSEDQIVAAIGALALVLDPAHVNKLRKYRQAIAFLENTFPIPLARRQAPLGIGVEAMRYVKNTGRPTATFTDGHVNFTSLTLTNSLALIGQEMTVTQYMEANAANTRVILIHLGEAQLDMGNMWDGLSALAHMNLVLGAARANNIHVCILRDPHRNGIGTTVVTPANAVCAGLRDQVTALAGTHVWVADGGSEHSAFHDPDFLAWVSDPSVDAVVVMGFDADVCVRGNVFGIAELDAGALVPALVPAIINFADVITARPLLSGGRGGTVSQFASWGTMSYVLRD